MGIKDRSGYANVTEENRRVKGMISGPGHLKESLARAAEIIKAGGVVAFPTETVYGLGADAFNPLAVARIFEIKRRPHFDPLIIHIAHLPDLRKIVSMVTPLARKLIDRFWPGPLTVVLSKKEEVPDIVTAGLETVAVRMPAHPISLSLIREAGCPLAAPSANPFGYLSPTTAEHVRSQLGDRVDLILDGGPCQVGVESTILSFVEERPVLLRPGGVPLEEIESVIGKVEIDTMEDDRPTAPGMLPRHYAPHTPILLNWSDQDIGSKRKKKMGLLAFREPVHSSLFDHIEVLSKNGDLREAASNLFAAIRRLDALNLDLILAESVSEEGLGRAIMDRLRRASHPGE
jgi:L-threonylcarbamoyladenylate synthase